MRSAFFMFVFLVLATIASAQAKPAKTVRRLLPAMPAASQLFAKSQPTGLNLQHEPHLAFFCKMENTFRNRYKVYLKFRAGNDEMYRGMIGESK